MGELEPEAIRRLRGRDGRNALALPHAANCRPGIHIGDNPRLSLDTPMNLAASFAAQPAIVCAVLLTLSNLFMTFAWYGHLKNLAGSPWWIAALVSWGIALFEYLLQVPANRIGFTVLSLGQLKILQEVITLSVFVPFSVLYM